MTNSQYKMRKAEAREILPEINLLPLMPYKDKQLNVTLFGPNSYEANLKNMSETYFHSKELSNITFKPAKTAESISIAAYDFANFAKPNIFDSRRLQAGWIVRTSEGLFANPPVNKQGSPITDEKTLKSFLKTDKKVNGIYLLDNDFGFAPYDSFTRGIQDCDTFAQGGLARILEYTKEKEAENLRVIASPKFYKGGVNVFGFDEVKESISKIVGLDSNGYLGDYRLDVCSYGWDDVDVGCAFGVLDSGKASKNF